MPRSRPPHSVLWEVPSRPRPTLTRDDLVRAALALLDEAGFDGLTMRNLAERLGVQAASLYNHVRDKREVLALLADAIMAEVPPPESADAPWHDALYWLACDYRRALLTHRDAARLLSETTPLGPGPNRLRVLDDLLGILRGAGFAGEAAADAAWLCNTFVTGFVLEEQTQLVSSDDAAAGEWQADVAGWLSQLPLEHYPNVLAVAGPLVDGETDRRFLFGLNTVLDGLELRLSTSRG